MQSPQTRLMVKDSIKTVLLTEHRAFELSPPLPGIRDGTHCFMKISCGDNPLTAIQLNVANRGIRQQKIDPRRLWTDNRLLAVYFPVAPELNNPPSFLPKSLRTNNSMNLGLRVPHKIPMYTNTQSILTLVKPHAIQSNKKRMRNSPKKSNKKQKIN
jgi:hypothetical protein